MLCLCFTIQKIFCEICLSTTISIYTSCYVSQAAESAFPVSSIAWKCAFKEGNYWTVLEVRSTWAKKLLSEQKLSKFMISLRYGNFTWRKYKYLRFYLNVVYKERKWLLNFRLLILNFRSGDLSQKLCLMGIPRLILMATYSFSSPVKHLLPLFCSFCLTWKLKNYVRGKNRMLLLQKRMVLHHFAIHIGMQFLHHSFDRRAS